MSWLARLKSEKAQEPTLGNLGNPHPVGLLGSLASLSESMQKNEGGFLASLASSRGSTLKVKAIGSTPAPGRMDTANDRIGPHPVDDPSPQFGLPATPDPDRCCRPHSAAMNRQEIDTFTARLARFTDKGMGLHAAERLADMLVIRDRESDDRRVCLECGHLQGVGRWRCGNWVAADVARDGLAPEWVPMLQRCWGFRSAMNGRA